MQDDNMQEWELTNAQKKSVEERTYWTKGDQTIVHAEVFRWGIYVYSGETAPEIDVENSDSIDMNCQDGWEMWELADGCWADWEFPDEMEQEEQDRLAELFENEYYDGLENEGWYVSDVEVWFHGPLLLEKKE